MQQRGVDLEVLEFLVASIRVQELQLEMWLHVLRCVCVENMWLEWAEGYSSCTSCSRTEYYAYCTCHVRNVLKQCCHFRKDSWATLARDLCRM